MKLRFMKDTFGWGFLFWLLGYILGILFFPIVPVSMIGWVIMPAGLAITYWVLWKKIRGNSFQYYFFLVKVFQPEDGYYKLDVYLYYALTFVLPLVVGRWFDGVKEK